MNHLPNVTICGCGSGGIAMAADLAMMGCPVNLYETPPFAANLRPIRERGAGSNLYELHGALTDRHALK